MNIFQQGMFQVDPSTTPEQLRRKRETLGKIVRGGYGNARYAGQGAMHALTGLVEGANEYKSNKFETEKRKEADQVFQDGFGGATVDDYMRALANPWLTPDQKSVIGAQLSQLQGEIAKREAEAKAAAARGRSAAAASAASSGFDSLFGPMMAGSAPAPSAPAPSPSVTPFTAGLMGGASLSAPQDYSGGQGADAMLSAPSISTQGDTLSGGEGSDVIAGPNPMGQSAAAAQSGLFSPLVTNTTRVAPQGFGLSRTPAPAPQEPRFDPLFGPELPAQMQYRGPSSREIMGLLSQPGLTPQQRAYAGEMLKRSMAWEDPQQRAMMRRQFNMETGRLPGADRETDFIDGVGLVDMNTGEVINDFGMAGRQPAADPKDVANFRKEFAGLQPVKDFETQASAFSRILASADNPSPAGDLSLIFQYMKILDPSSVVRESEFALAASAGDYGERIQAMVNKISTGETLSENIRNDFVKRAAELYDAGERRFKDISEQYGSRADRLGYDRADVVNDYRYKSSTAPTESVRPRLPMTPPSMRPAPEPTDGSAWTGPDLEGFKALSKEEQTRVMQSHDAMSVPGPILDHYFASGNP